jgi:hypothetical protein
LSLIVYGIVAIDSPVLTYSNFQWIVGQDTVTHYDLIYKNPSGRSLEPGMVGYLQGEGGIHRIENLSDKPAVSMHIYAPPRHCCNVVEPNAEGKFVRKGVVAAKRPTQID